MIKTMIATMISDRTFIPARTRSPGPAPHLRLLCYAQLIVCSVQRRDVVRLNKMQSRLTAENASINDEPSPPVHSIARKRPSAAFCVVLQTLKRRLKCG